MKRGLILTIILAMILATNVFALDVSYTPIQDQVLPGMQARYTLRIINNENTGQEIGIKTADLNWYLENSGLFRLEPGEGVDFNAVYKPIDPNMRPGKLGILYVITAGNKARIKDYLPVNVVDYNEVLDVNFVDSPVINPQRNSLLKLEVQNLKPINLVDLKVNIDSVPIKDSKTLNLIANEKDTIEFQVPPNPNVQEGKYNAVVTVFLGDKKLLEKNFDLNVGAYSNLQQISEPQSSFLTSGEKLTVVNNGNAVVTNTLKKKLTWMQNKFASFNPKPTFVEKTNEGYLLSWDYSLKPGEAFTVLYTVDYLTPLVYLIIVVGIVVAIYIWRKKDLQVTKRVLGLHTTEGNIAIMKVLIGVKNTGNAGLNEVKVMDKVPGTIKAPVEFGLIKPASVKNAGEQTILLWDIPHLKKGEEKIISYKIEGRVHILDTLTLPPALAKFGLGTKKKVFSSKSVSLSKKH